MAKKTTTKKTTTKKTTVKKATKKISKGRDAVLRAYKAGKIQTNEWHTPDGYPACPISTFACAYGLDIKNAFTPDSEDNMDYGFDEDKWIGMITKKFGVTHSVISHLVEAWDGLEINGGSVLLEQKYIKEMALSNMIDIFEKSAKKKSVVFGG